MNLKLHNLHSRLARVCWRAATRVLKSLFSVWSCCSLLSELTICNVHGSGCKWLYLSRMLDQLEQGQTTWVNHNPDVYQLNALNEHISCVRNNCWRSILDYPSICTSSTSCFSRYGSPIKYVLPQGAGSAEKYDVVSQRCSTTPKATLGVTKECTVGIAQYTFGCDSSAQCSILFCGCCLL